MQKKYQIFPKESIITLLVIIIIITIILFILDRNMPQYANWEIDNNLIVKDNQQKTQYINTQDYPLINIAKSNVSINTAKKILILGDSYIQGDGYSNLNQTWWKQLEIELHDRGYYDVDIYAVGRRGASTYDEMNWLTNTYLVKDINPDLIIIGYVSNDPELDDENGQTLVKHINTVNYFENNKLLSFFNYLFPNISYKINNMLNNMNEKEIKKSNYNNETGYPDGIWHQIIINEDWIELYRQNAVIPLSNYLNSIDIPSFIVTTPNVSNSRREKSYDVSYLFSGSNITTYNMFYDFRNMVKNLKDKSNTKINIVNGHPGTLYTKYYSDYIADILEKDYPQVLGHKYQDKIEYPIFINDWFPFSLNTCLLSSEKNSITYEITWPVENNMLYMPLEKKYIKLSLEYPIHIKEVKLEGKNLSTAEIYITTINNDKGYDDQSMKFISKQIGNVETFKIDEDELVTSICIVTNMKEKDSLEITIKR